MTSLTNVVLLLVAAGFLLSLIVSKYVSRRTRGILALAMALIPGAIAITEPNKRFFSVGWLVILVASGLKDLGIFARSSSN